MPNYWFSSPIPKSGSEPGPYPQNRIEAVRPAFEELGVTIREAFLAFGDYDVVSSLRRRTTFERRVTPCGGGGGRLGLPTAGRLDRWNRGKTPSGIGGQTLRSALPRPLLTQRRT
jgi:hypothetical protein